MADSRLSPEISRARVRRYAKANPERIRLKTAVQKSYRDAKYSDGSVTQAAIWSLLEKQEWQCAVSGVDLRSTPWSIDHIWPKCKGGENSMHNIQIVSVEANKRKNRYIPWEYCHRIPSVWRVSK